MKVIVRTYGANSTEEITVENRLPITIGRDDDGALRLTVPGTWGGDDAIARFAPQSWRAVWIAEEDAPVWTGDEDLASQADQGDEDPF